MAAIGSALRERVKRYSFRELPIPARSLGSAARGAAGLMTLRELTLRMRCSKCGRKAAEGCSGCGAETEGILVYVSRT